MSIAIGALVGPKLRLLLLCAKSFALMVLDLWVY